MRRIDAGHLVNFLFLRGLSIVRILKLPRLANCVLNICIHFFRFSIGERWPNVPT
jgi:hypothetical protein